MADLIARGTDWLNAKLNEHVSQSIAYARGAASVTVNAVIAPADRIVDPQTGAIVVASMSRQFLPMLTDIDWAALGALTDADAEPKRHDKITYDGIVYEVMPLFEDDQVFAHADLHRKGRIRIHTKRIGVV